MVFSELKSSLKNGIKPIYQIYGKDAFLRENALRILKEDSLKEPDLNLTNFTGASLKEDLDDFITATKSYPFLGDKRFVVVSGFYPTQKELAGKNLSQIFTSPEETTVLIIVNDKKCEALYKSQNVISVDCDKANDDIIMRWVKSETLKHQVVIGKEACIKLIEYCSSDMAKISSEVYKLISFVGNGNEITVSDIETVTSKDSDYEIYELTSFIADLKYDKAFEVFKELINKNQDKQRVFISIYYHFRRLLHISISNATDASLSGYLDIKEFAVKKARAQAKKFTPKRLKEICDKLSFYDSAFKCGDLTVDSVVWNSLFNAIIK